MYETYRPLPKSIGQNSAMESRLKAKCWEASPASVPQKKRGS